MKPFTQNLRFLIKIKVGQIQASILYGRRYCLESLPTESDTPSFIILRKLPPIIQFCGFFGRMGSFAESHLNRRLVRVFGLAFLSALELRTKTGSLRTICFQDRSVVYQSIIHLLDIEGKLEPLKDLFKIADVKCPTKINRDTALEIVDRDLIQWYVDNNILLPESGDSYRLEDEFLRVRLMFDEEELTKDAETRIIEEERYSAIDETYPFYDDNGSSG